MTMNLEHEGLKWQVDVWDRMSPLYVRELDKRFAPVVEGVIGLAALGPAERVIDLGCGTGAVTVRAARAVGSAGTVLAVDISHEMLALAGETAARLGLANIEFREGRAEAIPAADASVDVVLASLSLMYAIDRTAAAREIARVLRPGGRFAAAVWAGPASCDIVLFQQIAGSFAPPPPVAGVGPGGLGEPGPFLAQLREAGIESEVRTEIFGFDFVDLESAWDVLAVVTAAQLAPERREQAKAAVRAAMWPHGDGPRHFSNATHLIVGRRGPTS